MSSEPAKAAVVDPRPSWATDLSPTHYGFVLAYLRHLNGTQAAKDVGLSPRRAHTTAYDILQRPDVQAAISGALMANFSITKGTVLEELASIAFAKPMDYVKSLYPRRRLRKGESPDARDRELAQAASVFVGRKLDALEKLAKIAGLQRQAAEAEQGNTVIFVVEAPTDQPKVIDADAVDISNRGARSGALVIEGA